MSLKGPFKSGLLVVSEGYAVVDSINVRKGGSADVHVSVYGTPPVDSKVELKRLVNNVEEIYTDVQRDRGNILEHFTISGVDLSKSTNLFGDVYAQIKSNERLADMVNA